MPSKTTQTGREAANKDITNSNLGLVVLLVAIVLLFATFRWMTFSGVQNLVIFYLIGLGLSLSFGVPAGQAWRWPKPPCDVIANLMNGNEPFPKMVKTIFLLHVVTGVLMILFVTITAIAIRNGRFGCPFDGIHTFYKELRFAWNAI